MNDLNKRKYQLDLAKQQLKRAQFAAQQAQDAYMKSGKNADHKAWNDANKDISYWPQRVRDLS